MGRIVGERQALAFVDGLTFLLFAQADGVGTAMKASDDVALAPHPFNIVGSGAIHGSIEERLAESPHVNHDGEVAFGSQSAQPRTQIPSRFCVQPRQYEFLLLQCDSLQVFA